MTNKEKQLLLIDLCARLPYGVKCNVENIIVMLEGITEDGEAFADGSYFDVYDMKPYLRPMSSMTKEEIKEFHHMASMERDYLGDDNFYTHYQLIDWLNKNMFDYRGLIPMGLALKAKEGIYKNA